jgi:Fe-S-cluster containining protein
MKPPYSLRSARTLTLRHVRRQWLSASTRSGSSNSTSKTKKQAWFEHKGGLSFECTACGKCCTGSGGKVWVNGAEREEIAQFFSLSGKDRQESDYLVQENNNKWSIQMIPHDTSSKNSVTGTQEDEKEEKCIFLTNDNKCSIYKARPTQCQTFPFWPAIVASEHDWETTARSQCEGITTTTIASTDQNAAAATTKVVPSMDIWRNVIVHSVHRWSMQEEDDSDQNQDLPADAADAVSLTYDQMMEAMKVLDPNDVDDFRGEFVTNYGRDVLYQDEEILVLETTGKGLGVPSRAMIFKNSPTYSQSEIGLLPRVQDDEDKHENDTFQGLDHSSLLLDVHQVMSQAADMILLLEEEKEAQETTLITRRRHHVAVLGTGAGALPMYLHEKYPHAHMDCVDASSKVLELAQTYFGLDVDSPRLRLLCQLGETYASSQPLDLILVDVAATFSDTGSGGEDEASSSSAPQAEVLQVPPQSFLQDDFLERTNRLLSPQGLLVWNVVASSQAKLQENVMQKLNMHFEHVHIVKLRRNYVVLCSKIPRDWNRVINGPKGKHPKK